MSQGFFTSRHLVGFATNSPAESRPGALCRAFAQVHKFLALSTEHHPTGSEVGAVGRQVATPSCRRPG